MRWIPALSCASCSALLWLGLPAQAQGSDPFEQAVQGSSEALPDGVPSGSPDADLEHAGNSDAIDEGSGNPDAQLSGVGHPIRAHALNPDSLTTGSEDVSDLPSAASIDQPTAPASIAPAPPLPAGCGRPSGDSAWSSCLSTLNDTLARAQARLDAANGAYSRSITMQAPTGAARLAIVQERDAAQAEVNALSSNLATQVAQAREAGVSSWVTAPYRPKSRGW
jgi:hypothetical protein